MCRTCGCSADLDVAAPAAHDHAHGHDHDDDHGHDHDHAAPTTTGVVVPLEQRVLERNDRLAAETRRRLRARGVFAINLMSAPGAGKTSLLERMLHDLGHELGISVIEGDQATDHDAERVRAAGGRAVQINTGAGCHLDAGMVARALEELDPADGSVVVVENVGNLVCPALFDLGESARVVVTSVTDGDDKPLKYPHMFRAADVLLLNKVDLLPYVRFDRGRCLAYAREMNPRVHALEISATRGDGLDLWYGWLRQGAVGPWVTTGAP
jgi:hydrogenase nickel incorporation protein HypB